MRVLFLDIDGVLNNQEYFVSIWKDKISFKVDPNNIELLVYKKMMEIDVKRLDLLKEIVDTLSMKVVVTSSWKRLKIYPEIEKKLIEYGIPIIGITEDNVFSRGEGIKKYIKEHHVQEYIVLDDDIFKDYDDEILKRLVKTSYCGSGLDEEKKEEAIKLLKKY